MSSLPFELKPLTLGQILDRAFRIYRRSFLTFVGIVAVVQVPIVLIQLIQGAITLSILPQQANPFDILLNPELATNIPQPSVEQLLAAQLVQLIGIGVTILVSLLSYISLGALTLAIASSLFGQPITIREAYQRILGDALTLLLMAFLAVVVGIMLVIGSFISIVGICSLFGMTIAFAIAVQIAIPALVLERKTPFDSLRRGWDLIRRRFWWVIGFSVVISLLQQLIVVGPSLLIGLGLQFALGGTSLAQNVLALLGQVGLQGLTSIVFQPLYFTAIVMLYFDLRVRHEGLDVEIETALLENPVQKDMLPLLANAPQAGGAQILTVSEYFNMTGITVIFFGLYFALIAVIVAVFALVGPAFG